MRFLGMVGTTIRRTHQDGLSAFTFGPDELRASAKALHDACDFLESVYLATCNRMEVCFLCHRGVSVAEYRQRIHRFFLGRGRLATVPGLAERSAAHVLHAYEKDGAAEHLFCVAAGLDSLNPGDAQVLGQVKAALQTAQQQGLAGPHLSMVFEEAFQAAKRVRTKTELGARPISMLSLALDLIDQHLTAQPSTAVIIGAGEMSRQCGQHLRGRAGVDLVFVNRTRAKAIDLTSLCGGRALGLEEFLSAPGHVDLVVTATSAPEPILGASFFSRLQGTVPMVIDLAVQRDADPAAAQVAGVVLYDIDRLKRQAEANRRTREAEIADARVIVDEALDSLRKRVIERDLGPVVRRLRTQGEAAAEELLGQLLSGELAHLTEKEREPIRRFSQQIINRLLHIPTVGLKRLAQDHGMDAVDAFIDASHQNGR